MTSLRIALGISLGHLFFLSGALAQAPTEELPEEPEEPAAAPEALEEPPAEEPPAEPEEPEEPAGEQAAAAPGADPGEGTSPLLPEGEAERMAAHPVLGDQLYYQPGDGLVVESADGRFALETRVRVQLRYTVGPDDATGDTSQSMQARRARVSFAGHLFGEANEYKMELAIAPEDVDLRPDPAAPNERRTTLTPLLDAYFDFNYLRDLSVRVGQYKVPFSRERVISSGNLQFVDRSINNAEFALDRGMGVELRSMDLGGLDMFRYHAGVYVGKGKDAFELDDFGMMYLARFEFLPFGMFDDYDEGDFARTLAPRLSLGAGYGFVDEADDVEGVGGGAPADGGQTDVHVGNVDAVFMYGGLSATAMAFLRRGTNREDGDPTDGEPIEPPRDGWGVSGQVGYLIPRLPLEIAARYSAIRGDAGGSLEDLNELGAAVSWYFARHVFKIQADYFHEWNDDFDAGEDRFRIQLQASI